MANAYSKKRDQVQDVQSKYSDHIDRNFANNVTVNLKKIDLSKIQYIEVDDLYSAPTSWNFFSKLDDDTMYELAESVLDNGLMSPVILWKIDKKDLREIYQDKEDSYGFFGEDYMILSGHNRVRAFIQLSQNEMIGEKFLKVPAFVFEDLSEFQAKNIIIDANYSQRTLDVKEKVESILYKYDVYTKEKTKKGKVADFIADDLDVTPRMVYNYKKLADVIDPIKDKLYNGELALTSVLKLSSKTKEFQSWLNEECGEKLDNSILNKIKDSTKKTDIQRWLSKEDTGTKEVNVKIKIPKELETEFKEMAYQWIYNRTNR